MYRLIILWRGHDNNNNNNNQLHNIHYGRTFEMVLISALEFTNNNNLFQRVELKSNGALPHYVRQVGETRNFRC